MKSTGECLKGNKNKKKKEDEEEEEVLFLHK